MDMGYYCIHCYFIGIFDIMSNAGQPAKYKSQEELQQAIDSYFEFLQGEFTMVNKTDEEGEPYQEKQWIRYPEQSTITGLALHLGFESRQSIYDYEKKGEYSYTIKKARLQVEYEYEKALMGKSYAGAIFALKNFGWADKQEVDHTTKGESMNPTPVMFTKGSSND